MFNKEFLNKTIDSINAIDLVDIEEVVDILSVMRSDGRLFIIGSGGGAGHASHAACDFRKLCNFEAYAPYDNVSELTARTNDIDYASSIVGYLETSKLGRNDCIFVISVGGGKDNVSQNITNALYYAKSVDAYIVGIVGRDGGLTRMLADASVLIPTDEYTTPITEGLQAVIWHLIVTHPKLKIHETKW